MLIFVAVVAAVVGRLVISGFLKTSELKSSETHTALLWLIVANNSFTAQCRHPELIFFLLSHFL